MLVLLERLNEVERAVFVLRESFDLGFDQIAAIVERSEDNCRQILTRARRRLADAEPRFDADPVQRRALASRFLAAAREGDLDGLVALLAPDAVLIGDGGGDRPRDPAPDGRRRRDRPRRLSGSTGRSTRGASRSSRPGSTASPASARWTRTACWSTSSGSTSSTVGSRPIHSIAQPGQARPPRRDVDDRAAARLVDQRTAADVDRRRGHRAGAVGGHEGGDVADVLEAWPGCRASSCPRGS